MAERHFRAPAHKQGTDISIPPAKRSVAQLREEAEKYRRMAATARMAVALGGLLRLADRLDALADQRERETRAAE
ncbi:MAG TPA: hypothetical protein VL614_30250 [Acetobacteraceae bacterium]|jgi:hypothetical protein|nr:hypothetical protein [Acetobacteraceae bacterium]